MNGESTIQVKINLMQLLTLKCLKIVIEDNRLTLDVCLRINFHFDF